MTCQTFGKKSAKAKATQLIVLFESFIVFLLLEQRHSRHGTIDDMKTSSRWVDGVSRHLNTLRNIKSCVNIEVCPVCPLFSRDDVLLISITGCKLHSARQKISSQKPGLLPGRLHPERMAACSPWSSAANTTGKPLTILDDQFNSKRMQRGMLHFLNREWTQINANFSRGSGRCAPKRLLNWRLARRALHHCRWRQPPDWRQTLSLKSSSRNKRHRSFVLKTM